MRAFDWLGCERPLAVQPCAAMLRLGRVLLYCLKVRPVLVGNNLIRNDATPFNRLHEERFSAFQVAFLAQQHVYDLACFVHGAVEVGPFLANPHIVLQPQLGGE